MPVDIGVTGSASYRLPPGSYAKLLRGESEQQCAPDPRLLGEEDFEDLKAAGAARAAEMFTELLAAGEPVMVAAWEVPGCRPAAGAPEWFSTPAIYGGASLVRVYRDDVCEPAEFYGNAFGQVFERITVPEWHDSAR
jgi:hypothetical protein